MRAVERLKRMRLLHRLSVLAALMVIAGVMAACGDDDGTTVGAGEDVPSTVPGASTLAAEYVATGVTEDGVPRPILGGGIVMRFADGVVSVQAGCNSLSGEFRIVGATLQIEAMMQTDMGCAPELMAQDAWIAAFLTSQPTLAVSGGTEDESVLVLSAVATATSPESVITFGAPAAVPNAALVGTTWLVTAFIDGETATSPAMTMPVDPELDRRPRLVFDPVGFMTGHDGCNGFGYGGPGGEPPTDGIRYTVDGDPTAAAGASVDFEGHPTSTLILCEDIDAEAILGHLTGTVQVQIDGNSMTLTASDGQGITFEAEPGA